MKRVVGFLKKEAVMSISCVLALISMCIIKPDKQYGDYTDIRTLGILLSMMLITAGLKRYGFFEVASRKLLSGIKSVKGLITALVVMCFFFAMLITNDVALITLVPFAIEVLSMCKQKKHIIDTVVLMTIAANLGSMATPVGNPQNLYLYGLSNMSIGSFFVLVLPYVLVSFAMIIAACLWIGRGREIINYSLETYKVDPKGRLYIGLYIILFAAEILSVLRIVPYEYTLLIIVAFCVWDDAKLLLKADYSLLLTFVFLFVFIGNMKRIPQVYDLVLNFSEGREVLSSVVLSQVISNVPAAVLLSGFTKNYDKLIIGCNLGGLGTLIASMASLISFKAYSGMNGAKKMKYVITFTGYNIFFLAILLLMVR